MKTTTEPLQRNRLRPELPPMPQKMCGLRIDERGYPVPWFVAWIDGKPDHRIIDSSKLPEAVNFQKCWVCGNRLGKFKAFAIGPMSAINRTISEPPSHLECLQFAVAACPFLSRPNAQRREAGMPEGWSGPAGIAIGRNPGVVCIWVCLDFFAFQPGGRGGSKEGILFLLGDPVSTEWYAEGRPATRAEVDASIESGIPILLKEAEADPQPGAMEALGSHIQQAIAVLDRALPRQAQEARAQ